MWGGKELMRRMRLRCGRRKAVKGTAGRFKAAGLRGTGVRFGGGRLGEGREAQRCSQVVGLSKILPSRQKTF